MKLKIHNFFNGTYNYNQARQENVYSESSVYENEVKKGLLNFLLKKIKSNQNYFLVL